MYRDVGQPVETKVQLQEIGEIDMFNLLQSAERQAKEDEEAVEPEVMEGQLGASSVQVAEVVVEFCTEVVPAEEGQPHAHAAWRKNKGKEKKV